MNEIEVIQKDIAWTSDSVTELVIVLRELLYLLQKRDPALRKELRAALDHQLQRVREAAILSGNGQGIGLFLEVLDSGDGPPPILKLVK